MLNMRFIVTLSLMLFSGFFAVEEAYSLSKIAKVTIYVIDEDGRPIEGANAGFSFEIGKDVVPINGKTDSYGIFSATHINDTNHISFGADKDGYYESLGVYNFKDQGFGRWKPWNPEFRVVLRKIENPIPMYARNTRYRKLEIPIVGEKVGFDLVKFDWVAPYGYGLASDFLFKLEKQFIEDENYKASLSISFSNQFDGAQLIKEDMKYGSEFKLPRLAPELGYQNELNLQISRSPGEWVKLSSQENDNYIFRVRSEASDGKLIKGLYGKIHGPIEFFPHASKTAIIVFKYYLNPDYTRNLEFDPKRNLFGTLPPLEQVKEP